MKKIVILSACFFILFSMFFIIYVCNFSTSQEAIQSELKSKKDKIPKELLHNQILDSINEITLSKINSPFKVHFPYLYGTIINNQSPVFSFFQNSKKEFYGERFTRGMYVSEYFEDIGFSPNIHIFMLDTSNNKIIEEFYACANTTFLDSYSGYDKISLEDLNEFKIAIIWIFFGENFYVSGELLEFYESHKLSYPDKYHIDKFDSK